jgi:membrane protease YdiL (CAAX protease family)
MGCILPLFLALLAAVVIDRASVRRGLDPPGFAVPPEEAPGTSLAQGRRYAAIGVMTLVLWIGVFSPLSLIGAETEVDLSSLRIPQLFLLHGLFVAALAAWYFLGFFSHPPTGFATGWIRQLGLRAASVGRELALGAACGIGAWFVVIVVLLTMAGLMWTFIGEDSLPQQPPPMIPWIAALPIWARMSISLSAGVVEETFFRGFLQPRIGIAASTGLFALAHLSYDQPLMLVGITLLSVVFGLLVRWRQSIWAAIAAHTVFDAVQLLIVVPWALDFMDRGGVPLA